MASVITNDPVERTTLSTLRTMGAMMASLFINALGPLIVFVDNKADANRIFNGSDSCLVFFLSLVIWHVINYQLNVSWCLNLQQRKKANLGKTVKGLLKNKPLISILVASLLFMVNLMLIGTVNVYLFKEYFSNATALSLSGFFKQSPRLLLFR